MRILLTNNTLAARAGTELYLRDTSKGLLERGHEVIAFSLELGAVAEEMQAAGVVVIDDLLALDAPPDVIHGQHAIETTFAAMFFMRTPVIAFCHSPEAWQDAACRLPNVVAYVAVDAACKTRLIEDERVPADQVHMLLNFVDLELFNKVRTPNPTPQKALIFSNYLHPKHAVTSVLEAVCKERGIQLDFCGGAFHQQTCHPETLLPEYDVVFAKGRCAVEALACGCSVLPVEFFGAGGMVTPDNYERMRQENFGRPAMPFEVTPSHIMEQLDRYDAGDVARVTAQVRAEVSLQNTLDQLEKLYAYARTQVIPPFEAVREAADFLRLQLYLSRLPFRDLTKTLGVPLRLPVPPISDPLPDLWQSICSKHAHVQEVLVEKWKQKIRLKDEKIATLRAEILHLKTRPRGLKKLLERLRGLFASHDSSHD